MWFWGAQAAANCRLAACAPQQQIRSAEDAEIRMGETSDVRKDRRQIRSANPEPGRERRGKFVHRGRRDPAALPGIVGTVDRESGESAEQSSTLDGAAENELMTSPAVV